MREGESDALGDAPPPAGGCAGEDHTGKDHTAATKTEEMGGPTPKLALAPEGDEPAPEQLDWGSIEDEDGAFGQLAEASHIEDTDPAPQVAPLPIQELISLGGEQDGPVGGRAAITTAPLPATADLVEATSAHVGSNEDADPGLPGAQKTTGRQSDAREMGIDGATIAGTPPLASSLEVVCYDGPVDTREHLQPSATLVPAAEQPRPTAAVECRPDTAPLLQSDRGKKPASAVDTVLDSDNSMATCTINPAPATNSGTRIPCNDKGISKAYAREYLPGGGGEKQLRMRMRLRRKDNAWEPEFQDKYGRQQILGKGWREFVTDNKLKRDDICLFNLMKNTKMLTMDVHIIRKRSV